MDKLVQMGDGADSTRDRTMSRSIRKSPFIGNCSTSDKPGKVLANRALRARARQTLYNCCDLDNLVMPVLREVSNVWSFPKDGKSRIARLSADELSKLMRK